MKLTLMELASQFGLIAGAALIADRVLHHIQKRNPAHWLMDLFQAAYPALRMSVWAHAFIASIQLLRPQPWYPKILTHLPLNTVSHLVLVWVFAWSATRLLATLESRPSQRLDAATVHTLCRLGRFTAYALAALVALQSLGVPLSGVMTFGGIGGIGVALAAKDLLANLFGGLMIFLDRPFAVGDWIRSPNAEIEGTVEHIGWRLTRIRTFDKRARYVPNHLFSTLVIDNPSRMTHRRIKTSVGIRYNDANVARTIVDDVATMLRNHPEIDSKQTLMVYFDELGKSSLNFFIYCFTKTTQWVKFQEIQQDVLLKTLDIISKHGGECAFPSRSLYLVGNDESKADASDDV